MLLLLGLTACHTGPPKDAVTLRMHLPASPALQPTRRMMVEVHTPAMSLQVDRLPVLSENDLDHAELVGEGENYDMRLTFTTHGTIVLDTVTINARGQQLVIMLNNIAVAAPMLSHRIADGVFEFTPDMPREEAEKVVKGLMESVKWLAKHPGGK